MTCTKKIFFVGVSKVIRQAAWGGETVWTSILASLQVMKEGGIVIVYHQNLNKHLGKADFWVSSQCQTPEWNSWGNSERRLCSSLKQERQPPPPALHTAGTAPRVSQGSANPSHSSALLSPGKRQHLAAAAPSDFQASAKQLGKTAPAPSSLLQALRKQSRVWACESWAQQTICYSRIAKNAPVWPAWTCRGWHSPSSWHFWCFPLLRGCQGAWGIPTELEETKETQVLLTALHQDEVQPETTEFVLGVFFFV